MPFFKFTKAFSLSIALMIGIAANSLANGPNSMLSRFQVGQAVELKQAKSGSYEVTILATDQLTKGESSTICEVGTDYIAVKSDHRHIKMISIRAIDVVNSPAEIDRVDSIGFRGTWDIGGSVLLHIKVDGDQVSATYPELDGTIEGTIIHLDDGRDILNGRWETFAGQGTITLILDESGSTFQGGWHNLSPIPEYADLKAGIWSGSRVNSTPRPPESKPQATSVSSPVPDRG